MKLLPQAAVDLLMKPLPPTPCFYDMLLNCVVHVDPTEQRRLRDREWYSQNRDEINRRRREAYKQKKAATANINTLEDGTHATLVQTPATNMVSHTPATGQSAVTQLQKRKFVDGVVSNLQHGHRLNLDKENICEDNEGQWLHRNDSYEMTQISRRRRNVLDTFHTDPQTTSSNIIESIQCNVFSPELWGSKVEIVPL